MDISNQLSKVIDVLSQKLGIAVDKVYPMLIKQTRYALTTDIILFIVCISSIIVIVMWSKIIYKNLKAEKGFYYDNEGWQAFAVSSIIAIGITSIILMFVFAFDAIQIIINPNWYILNDLIKPLINK